MYHYQNKEFGTRKEMLRFLSDNHDSLVAVKKAEYVTKDMDLIVEPKIIFDAKTAAIKAEGKAVDYNILSALKVIAIINTTNWLDSHMDVHIPGIWNQSVKNNKSIMHLQEHIKEFDKIIADGDQLKAYTKKYTWKELGYDFAGETEALVFDSEILKERNPYMLQQYAKGWVRNHSVGMRYVKTDMAINDEDMPNYYEAWQKYYPQIINPEMADELGYFWYVLEAKVIEGSAVPIGSNTATPTYSVGEPSKGTPGHHEPVKTTQGIDYSYLIENLKRK